MPSLNAHPLWIEGLGASRAARGGGPTPGASGARRRAQLALMRGSEELARQVLPCDVCCADGQTLMWLSKLLARPLPERITGPDLLARLLPVAGEKGWRRSEMRAPSTLLVSWPSKARAALSPFAPRWSDGCPSVLLP